MMDVREIAERTIKNNRAHSLSSIRVAQAYLDLLSKNTELEGQIEADGSAYRGACLEAVDQRERAEAAEQQVKELRAKREGMVLVPLEPTEEMIESARGLIVENELFAAENQKTYRELNIAIYKAMIKEEE